MLRNEIKLHDESANKQHELEVFQCVIEQLDRLKHHAEIKQILDTLEEDKATNLANLNSLRNQILAVYKTENSRRYDKLFYDAIFSLLLLLAKHAPKDVDRIKEDGSGYSVTCMNSGEEIEAPSRILTSSGYQFDGKLPSTFKWLQQRNHPATREILGQREKDYLTAREKAINANDAQTQEIPHPQKLPPKSLSERGASIGRRVGIALGVIATIAITIIIAPNLLAFMLMLAINVTIITAVALIGKLVGAALGKLVCLAKNHFSPPTVTSSPVLISSRTEKIFSHIIEAKNEIAPQPKAKLIVPPVKRFEPTFTQIRSRLEEKKLNKKMSDDLRQPLLPKKSLPRGLDSHLDSVSRSAAAAIAEKKAAAEKARNAQMDSSHQTSVRLGS